MRRIAITRERVFVAVPVALVFIGSIQAVNTLLRIFAEGLSRQSGVSLVVWALIALGGMGLFVITNGDRFHKSTR